MSTAETVRDAREALGRRLRYLRQEAGLTQQQAGARTGYARSTISWAERTGIAARDFWLRAGSLVGAGDALAVVHDQILARASAARAAASRQARALAGEALPDVPLEDAGFTVLEAACPHCGKPVAVVTRVAGSVFPVTGEL